MDDGVGMDSTVSSTMMKPPFKLVINITNLKEARCQGEETFDCCQASASAMFLPVRISYGH